MGEVVGLLKSIRRLSGACPAPRWESRLTFLKNAAASEADFYVRFFVRPVGRSRHPLFSYRKTW